LMYIPERAMANEMSGDELTGQTTALPTASCL